MWLIVVAVCYFFFLLYKTKNIVRPTFALLMCVCVCCCCFYFHFDCNCARPLSEFFFNFFSFDDFASAKRTNVCNTFCMQWPQQIRTKRQQLWRGYTLLAGRGGGGGGVNSLPLPCWVNGNGGVRSPDRQTILTPTGPKTVIRSAARNTCSWPIE